MDIKNITLGKVKAGPEAGLKKGQMLAYASVFGNVDSYGDVVVKGAFANTLADWRKSGRTIPLLYGHNMSDPTMNIGAVLEAEEDDRGLKILAQFDDDAMAQKVYGLVKAGRIAELSFAFDTVKQAFLDDETRPGALRELQELKLYECSVVPIGANSETEVIAVKAAVDAVERLAERSAEDAKAGRSLSKANESSLREVATSLASAKAALEKVLPPDDDDENDDPEADPEGDDNPDDTPPNGDEEDDKPKGGVSSGARGAAPSSDTAPILGEEWTKALTAAVAEALETVLKAAGVTKLSPPNDPAAKSSDMLVTEIQLLELGDISE